MDSMRVLLTRFLLLIILAANSVAQDPLSEDKGQPAAMDDARVRIEIAVIEAVWQNFNEAIDAGDKLSAVQYLTPDKREDWKKNFELLGAALPKLNDDWSDLIPTNIGDEIATYAMTQVENGVKREHSVYFYKHPKIGWVVYQF